MPATRALWIWLSLLVLARALLAFVPSMWGWGLNVQRFLDPFLGWVSWAVMALALVPAVAKRGVQRLENLGEGLAQSQRAIPVMGLLGAALAWLMPDRVWFVGDFLIRMGNVETGLFVGNYVSAMPLDRFLHGTLLQLFGKGSAVAAHAALRALGAIEAGLLAALAVAFVRAARLTGIFAVLAAGIVFFGGYLTMFTGLGKPASELCLATVALATFGLRAIEKRSSLLPCGLVMAGALLLHRSSVILLPAWLWVVVSSLRAAEGRRARHLLGIGLPVVVGIFTIPRILAIATEYDVERHAGSLSRWHLLALANLVVALSPLALITPLLLALRGPAMWARRDARLLLVLALSFVPAVLWIHPQQGVFRDWDVFAPAGVAFSLLAAWAVVETVAATPSRTWVALPTLALVFVSSLQWLALNHDPSRGLARVRAYLLEPPGESSKERALTWDFLTIRNLRLGRWSEAADAAAHAAIDAPHRRIFLMWALASTMARDYAGARRVYLELLARDPDDPLGWLGLAGIARRMNDRAELERALVRLRSYPADGPEMRTIRRHLEYYPQVWPEPDTVAGWSPRAPPPPR